MMIMKKILSALKGITNYKGDNSHGVRIEHSLSWIHVDFLMTIQLIKKHGFTRRF